VGLRHGCLPLPDQPCSVARSRDRLLWLVHNWAQQNSLQGADSLAAVQRTGRTRSRGSALCDSRLRGEPEPRGWWRNERAVRRAVLSPFPRIGNGLNTALLTALSLRHHPLGSERA